MIVRALGRLYDEDRFIGYLLLAFVALSLIAIPWDLPGFYGWENDGIAPRDFLGGIADNLLPGHAHRYPLFHYLVVGLLSAPVLLVDVAVALLTDQPVKDTVVSVPSMTAIALLTKLLHVAMTCVTLLALAKITRTLFSKTTARYAAGFALTNLSVAYYGRVTNADGPYVMWVTLALLHLVTHRHEAPPRASRSFAFFMAAAVATKDQAYAPLLFTVPLYYVAVPLLFAHDTASRKQLIRPIGKTLLMSLGMYGVLSGALLNPLGFATRLRMLTGTNSQDWRAYAPGLAGKVANLWDIVRLESDFFWPWPVVIAAWLGVLFVLVAPRRGRDEQAKSEKLWRLLPLLAGLGSLFAFALVVGRAEHRFVLPLGLYLSVYVGHLVTTVSTLSARRSATIAGAGLATVGLLLGLRQNLELVMTQWFDPRRSVEEWLLRLGRVRVETYGLGVYLPRFDLSENAAYSVTRVSALESRKAPYILGLREVRDDYSAIEQRKPDVLILPEGFANRFRTSSAKPSATRGAMREYQNATGALTFFQALLDDRLPNYQLVGKTIVFPRWYTRLGGRAIRVHGSTGEPLWISLRRLSRNP